MGNFFELCMPKSIIAENLGAGRLAGGQELAVGIVAANF